MKHKAKLNILLQYTTDCVNTKESKLEIWYLKWCHSEKLHLKFKYEENIAVFILV